MNIEVKTTAHSDTRFNMLVNSRVVSCLNPVSVRRRGTYSDLQKVFFSGAKRLVRAFRLPRGPIRDLLQFG